MIKHHLTCVGCGGQFTGRKRKYCTVKCRDAARRRAKGIFPRQAACHQTHECFWCDASFKPKRAGRDRYCSRECFFAFKAARSELIDEMSVSCKIYKAKCKNCGRKFEAQVGAMYCSAECKGLNVKLTAKRFYCAECNQCVQTSYRDKRKKFCSNVCSRRSEVRVRRKMERARLRNVQVEKVDPIKVFERDGWKCQICGGKTPKAKRGMIDERAPELDHIVPLSVGGEHSYKNTQCACRECNGKKGNRVYGQIPMFAT